MAEEKKTLKKNAVEEKVEKPAVEKKVKEKATGANKKKKTILISVVSVVLVVLTALLILFAVLYNTNANDQFYKERSESMVILTSKVGNVVDAKIDSIWENVNACEGLSKYAKNASGADITTLTMAAENMKKVALKGDEYTVFLIDSNLNYASNINTGKWSESYMLQSNDAVYFDTVSYTGVPTDSLVFVNKLASPAVNTYGTINYIVVTVDVASFKSAFALDTAQEGGITYIYSSNGSVKSSYAVKDGYLATSNIYELLQNDGKVDGIDTIKSALSNDDTVCVEFQMGKDDYFFAATTLSSMDDAYVATIIPTASLVASSTEFSSSSIIFYVEIAIIVAVMIGCVIMLLVMALKDRQIVVQQQEQNVKIEQVVQKAESASNAKIEFLENMSHDIRTPINGILGMTAIALREPNIPAKVEYCLFKIDTASHHLLSLVNDVLDMSHIESGKTEIVHEPMDIRKTINNCVNIIQGKMADRSLQLITEFDQFKHPQVYGDELHLRQILMNILGNAEKFTPDGGKIMFRVKEKYTASNKLVYFFEIEDTGCGMKPEFLAHIFEPFTQEAGGARTQFGGTGLGMSITKKYVDMMGGKIAVKSEVGVGTIFTVGLPFDADTSAHANADAEVMPDLVESSPLDGVKVLLVEDNELNREVAQALLQDQGMHVSAAVNGQNAVFLFKNNPPGTYDIILMDIMMPVMDGLEATKQIRAMDRPDAKKIPIIAMTANAFEEDVRKSYDAGMNEHLSKPIILETLIKVLSKFVNK